MIRFPGRRGPAGLPDWTQRFQKAINALAEADRRRDETPSSTVGLEVMVEDIDPAIAQTVALGQRNAEVIELFERFCRNVRVEVLGGVGLVEQQTGLPVGMRAFRCAYASGGIAAGMNLEDLALDFYEQNCRGCADRTRSGWLGETIATLADAKRAAQEARKEQARVEAEERRRQRDERSARRSRRGAGEPYPSVAQLERVDRLDPPEGSPEAADIEWLTRTASLAPEVITDATVAELVELAQPRRYRGRHVRRRRPFSCR